MSCSSYSETQEKLQGITRVIQALAEETVRSRNGTASPGERDICGKGLCCSQPHWPCQEGHSPSAPWDCSFDVSNATIQNESSTHDWGATLYPPKGFFTLCQGWGFWTRLHSQPGCRCRIRVRTGREAEWEHCTGVGLQRICRRKGKAAKSLCNNWWRVWAENTVQLKWHQMSVSSMEVLKRMWFSPLLSWSCLPSSQLQFSLSPESMCRRCSCFSPYLLIGKGRRSQGTLCHPRWGEWVEISAGTLGQLCTPLHGAHV